MIIIINPGWSWETRIDSYPASRQARRRIRFGAKVVVGKEIRANIFLHLVDNV